MKTAAFSRKLGRVMQSDHMARMALETRWEFMRAVAAVETEDQLDEDWQHFIAAALESGDARDLP